jgi:HSP20 family protein
MLRLQREMDRIFTGLALPVQWPSTAEYPPIALYRGDNTLTVESLCPGVDRKTLDVTLVGETLTIRCERKPPADVPDERYRRRERRVGAFTRTIDVGERFDPDRTEATYKLGILRVQLARAGAAPKKIPVQA